MRLSLTIAEIVSEADIVYVKYLEKIYLAMQEYFIFYCDTAPTHEIIQTAIHYFKHILLYHLFLLRKLPNSCFFF